jgi:hypothetical protein
MRVSDTVFKQQVGHKDTAEETNGGHGKRGVEVGFRVRVRFNPEAVTDGKFVFEI